MSVEVRLNNKIHNEDINVELDEMKRKDGRMTATGKLGKHEKAY